MRIFGHPLHPLLVHFPIALWSLASLCDGLIITGLANFYDINGLGMLSSLFLVLGIAFAIPAMMAGMMDVASVPEAASGDVNVHLMCMGGAWIAYLSALITRLEGVHPLSLPGWLSVALGFLGLACMMIGGWFGGQLVYKHGVGVHSQDDEPRLS